METSRPTVTGPDEQGAFGIQDGTEIFYMHPRGKNDLVYEQHGFNSFEDTCSAIGLVVSELHAEQVGNNFCYDRLGIRGVYTLKCLSIFCFNNIFPFNRIKRYFSFSS